MGIINLIDPNYKLDHQIKKIQIHLDNGDMLHAYQLLRKIEEPDASEFHIAALFIEYYSRQGKISSANDVYKNYLKENPEDYSMMIKYGKFLFHYRKWNSALKIWRKLKIKNYPNLAYLSGYCAFKAGHYLKAQRYFEYYINQQEEDGIHAAAYYYLSFVYGKLKKYQEALPLIESLITFYKDDPRVNRLAAFIYYKCGMSEHALRTAKKALTLLKDNKLLLALSIRIMLTNKIGMKTLDLIKNYEKIQTERSEREKNQLLFWYADAYLYSKKYPHAKKQYEMILAQDPQCQKALHALKIIARKYG